MFKMSNNETDSRKNKMSIITFCLAHSRRLQAFLPFKNNCGCTCLHSEDGQTMLSFPLTGGQENSSLSGERAPTLLRKSVFTNLQSACLLP